MSIAKKLPAVLIAAVGISFSFAGTALTEEPIFAEKTLEPREVLEIRTPDRLSTEICYKATNNSSSFLLGILSFKETTGEIINVTIPRDIHTLKGFATSDHVCVIMSLGRFALVRNMQSSESVHVYARQHYEK